jgi:hypothetical protein
VLGFLFGWSLHKAGLTHYARIVNVYRFRDLTVMRFMFSALLTGAVATQLGVDLAGLSGLVVGAIVFGLLQPTIMPVLARVGALGRVTFAGLAGASSWLVLLVFGQAVLLLLVLIAGVGVTKRDVGSARHSVQLPQPRGCAPL